MGIYVLIGFIVGGVIISEIIDFKRQQRAQIEAIVKSMRKENE